MLFFYINIPNFWFRKRDILYLMVIATKLYSDRACWKSWRGTPQNFVDSKYGFEFSMDIDLIKI